jgi:hypothetical protein
VRCRWVCVSLLTRAATDRSLLTVCVGVNRSLAIYSIFGWWLTEGTRYDLEVRWHSQWPLLHCGHFRKPKAEQSAKGKAEGPMHRRLVASTAMSFVAACKVCRRPMASRRRKRRNGAGLCPRPRPPNAATAVHKLRIKSFTSRTGARPRRVATENLAPRPGCPRIQAG